VALAATCLQAPPLAAAQAAVLASPAVIVTTPVIVGGPAVTATVTAPASQALVSFTLAQPTDVVVTLVSWTFPAGGAVSTYLTGSSGRRVGSRLPLDGSGPWSAAPQSLAEGSYDVVVDAGSSGDSGSVTVQLTAVGSITVNGNAISASIGAAGQPELFAFMAAAGTTVAAAASNATFSQDDGATLSIENAAGVPQGPVRFVGISATVYAEATLTQSGTFYVALRPAGVGSMGTATLALQSARPPVPATVGGPASTIAITAPGVPGTATFTGAGGQDIGVVVNSTTFTGYGTRVYVTDSDGVPVGPEQYLSGTGTADGPVTLPYSGTYTVVVDPGTSGATGTVSLSLITFTDLQIPAVVGGSPVNATITEPTQRAFVAFTATANEQVVVQFSESTFTDPADVISLEGQGGTVIEGPAALTGTSGSLPPVTLTASGSYTVLIDPSFDGDTGSVSITIASTTDSARAVSPARPAHPARRHPAAKARSRLTPASASAGPTFTVSYNYTDTDLFTDGGYSQGYDDTYQDSATWTQAANGSVTGSASETNTGRTWLYQDICIIANLSDSYSSGRYNGQLTLGEVTTSPQADGSTSYTIYPAPITLTGTQASQGREYDSFCGTSVTATSGPWQGEEAPSPIQGVIPAGQSTASGHSSCGSGTTVGTPIGSYASITTCSLNWTVNLPYLAALGDSYSSGNGTPQASGRCSRSPQAWPHLVPDLVNQAPGSTVALSPQIDLLACSGADSDGNSTGEEDLPAQIKALRTRDRAPAIVTVTIGGDDGRAENLGFRNVLSRCARLHCDNAYLKESRFLRKKEPSLLERDFQDIKRADSTALIFVVGYPHIFKNGRRCLVYSADDVREFNSLTDLLNSVIQSAAKVAGLLYRDATDVFSGHELCSAAPWVISPLDTGAGIGPHDWLHPNVIGQKKIAGLVASFIATKI
jgi:hypothetical protein